MPEKLINLRMDDEDQALLDACVRHEKLTKSDIIRRALRAYADRLGLKVSSDGSARRVAAQYKKTRKK